MADILHLDLYRKDKPLKDLIDPCTGCDKQSRCCSTCQFAIDWWGKFTERFKRRKVINRLGGE